MRKFSTSEQLTLILHFLARYRSVERFPFLSQADIRAYQFRKIKHLLDIAYTHTPFYRRKYAAAGIHPADIRTWEDFQHLPTVTKDEVIAHGPDLVDQRRRPSDLILSRSSGSTGQFVNIYLDAQHFIVQALQVIRMLRDGYPDYGPFDKELLVYTSEYPIRSIGGMYRVVYVNNLLPAEQIYAAMQRTQPAVVAIYPSILREVIQRYGDKCRSLGIKMILTNSEHSTQAERDAFARAFGCPVFDEYSSEELSSIAYQCREWRYHLVQDCSYTEILEPDADRTVPHGHLGEIVGTCLINTAMPLIRYRQGDMAVMSDAACACGKTAPILAELSGRKNASFTHPNSTNIPSGRILDWTYSLVLTYNLDICEVQVTQVTLTEVEIILVPGPSYDPINNHLLVDSFKATFGHEFAVTVVLVSSIAKTGAGKHIPIRSLVHDQNEILEPEMHRHKTRLLSSW